MSRFRSYFSKNNTLIKDNVTNNSQNPVTEISYGTINRSVSRFIFDVDLQPLINRINNGEINPSRITKHILHMTNTIRYSPEYIGDKSYSSIIQRASAFQLDLFNVMEDWDEGSGYDFEYYDNELPTTSLAKIGTSNWFYRKNQLSWVNGGAYTHGVNQIIGSQNFDNGNEDIKIDVTDYINNRLSNVIGGEFGLGIKFVNQFEEIESKYRQAVAFHTRHTNTFYEPFIETIIDDNILDDRNYFFMDKENDLYLYVNAGGRMANSIEINRVEIYDNDANLVTVISGYSINVVANDVYKITHRVNSNEYPDGVIFSDVWIGSVNGALFRHVGEFYLISSKQYYSFNNSHRFELDNYHFNFWGIKHNEKIRRGDLRKVKLIVRELYPIQDNHLPLDLKYRLFMTNANNYEVDIIPYTNINRTNVGYEFNIDTIWMIPQDYKIQIRLNNGNYFENKETLQFTIVSDGRIF